MEDISELMKMLNCFFKCNKPRLHCLAVIVMNMIVTRTVNLAMLANTMIGKAKEESRYRQLRRFFQFFKIDYNLLAKKIVEWFFCDGKYYLVLDRTNWKWGKKDINILMLGIAYKGIAIPIFWLVLNKGGSSSWKERRALMQRFIAVFGTENIAGILADREFVGREWFRYLVWKKIPFYIRVKDNTRIVNKKRKIFKVEKLFHDLLPGEKLAISEQYTIFGRDMYVTGARSPTTGKLMIVVSANQTEDAIEIYLKRWEIENLFSCLKSRGFNFEDTHITDRAKIKKMIALLSLSFCWAHKTGEWREKEYEGIRLKSHQRPEKSIFRYGLDFLRTAIFKIFKERKLFRKCLRLFLAPPDSAGADKMPRVAISAGVV